MRFIATIATVALISISPAVVAQTTSAPATAKPASYTTADTDLGTLLDNPAAKAVLEKYIPDMVKSEQIGAARPMTLKSLQQYAGDTLTDSVLAKIDADLAKVPVK